jgi:hypothetical protein
MANIRPSQPVLGRILIRTASAVNRASCLRSASPSPAKILGHFVQEVLGVTLLLLGIGLIFTLVLMPIGLPLALLGVSLIAAPSDS